MTVRRPWPHRPAAAACSAPPPAARGDADHPARQRLPRRAGADPHRRGPARGGRRGPPRRAGRSRAHADHALSGGRRPDAGDEPLEPLRGPAGDRGLQPDGPRRLGGRQPRVRQRPAGAARAGRRGPLPLPRREHRRRRPVAALRGPARRRAARRALRPDDRGDAGGDAPAQRAGPRLHRRGRHGAPAGRRAAPPGRPGRRADPPRLRGGREARGGGPGDRRHRRRPHPHEGRAAGAGRRDAHRCRPSSAASSSAGWTSTWRAGVARTATACSR